eukprot:6239074-Amphidinium_carterae.2
MFGGDVEIPATDENITSLGRVVPDFEGNRLALPLKSAWHVLAMCGQHGCSMRGAVKQPCMSCL